MYLVDILAFINNNYDASDISRLELIVYSAISYCLGSCLYTGKVKTISSRISSLQRH